MVYSPHSWYLSIYIYIDISFMVISWIRWYFVIGFAQKLEVELLSKKSLDFLCDIAEGLEILLDHWLHQCTGLSDSHPSRGDSATSVGCFFSMFLFVKIKSHGFEWLLLHLLTHTFTPLFVGLLLYIYVCDDMTWLYLCRLLLSYFCCGQVTRQNSKKNWALDDMVTHTEAMSLMGRVGWNMLKLWHRHSMMGLLESPNACMVLWWEYMPTHDMIIIDHIWSYSPFIYSLKRYIIHIYIL